MHRGHAEFLFEEDGLAADMEDHGDLADDGRAFDGAVLQDGDGAGLDDGTGLGQQAAHGEDGVGVRRKGGGFVDDFAALHVAQGDDCGHSDVGAVYHVELRVDLRRLQEDRRDERHGLGRLHGGGSVQRVGRCVGGAMLRGLGWNKGGHAEKGKNEERHGAVHRRSTLSVVSCHSVGAVRKRARKRRGNPAKASTSER